MVDHRPTEHQYPAALADSLQYWDGPPAQVVRELIHVLFFASLEKEEGQYMSLGIVYVPRYFDLLNKGDWDRILFVEARPFTAAELTKLAGALTFGTDLLIVSDTPWGLFIMGIATPHSRKPDRDITDKMLRLLSPRPGALSGWKGSTELARYERGEVVTSATSVSPFDFGPHRVQLDSIRNAALSIITPEPEKVVLVEHLHRILARVALSGHGGLLAILPPGAIEREACSDAKWIDDQVHFGSLLDLMYSQQQWRSKRRGRPDHTERKIMYHVERQSARLATFMTVDGAVLCSHDLRILAFGAKLSAPADASVEVFDIAVDGDRPSPGRRWQPGERGTRHRAAALFAKKYERGIALIVSQDGQTAAFQQVNGAVVYWPIPRFFFRESSSAWT